MTTTQDEQTVPDVPPTNGAKPDASQPPAPHRPWYRRRLVLVIGAVAALVLAVVGVRYLAYAMAHESTDDAFIAADVVAVSPKVASYVARRLIDDNQHVAMGDVVVALDPRDFEARLAQARANLSAGMAQHRAAQLNVQVVETTSGAGVEQADAGVRSAQRQIEEAQSRLEQARAQVGAADAEAVRARGDLARYQELVPYGAVTQQERDRAVAQNRAADSNLESARKAEQAALDALRLTHAQHGESVARLENARAAPTQVAYSRAQADAAAAQMAQLQAAVRAAELDLSYTKIIAPVSGKVTRKRVERGDYVQVGQTLFSLVPDRVWVIANFKETQLQHMRPGQPVVIHVDAYPDRVFRGHVDSIQSGSGAAFSVLPPENATGNYVKIVQRVPVKILIEDPPDPARPLGPGMSVVPEVQVR